MQPPVTFNFEKALYSTLTSSITVPALLGELTVESERDAVYNKYEKRIRINRSVASSQTIKQQLTWEK
jgi:hypothetical protein